MSAVLAPAKRETKIASKPARPTVASSAPRVHRAEAAAKPIYMGGSGERLAPSVLSKLENAFQVNLDSVRVHSDGSAQRAAAAHSARAFAVGGDIYLGRGESAMNTGLIAHETAHVLQQQGGVALQRWSSGSPDSFEHEAHQAAAAVLSGGTFEVRQRTTGKQVQKLLDPLDDLAEYANAIPGFRMFTIVLGVNPINMLTVNRSAANVLRAVVEFMPGGFLITKALDQYGVFDKAGEWVNGQLRTLGMVGSQIWQALKDFVASLRLRDALHPFDVWERAKHIVTDPIDRLIGFVKGLVTGILGLIRDAILKPLAHLAEGTPGWDLLKAILGSDPITGEPVARNADTLIGGFMKLIGQEEVWNNIKKANAAPRAWAWFQGALSGLLGFVRAIPGQFLAALRSLVIEDLVVITRAFTKIAGAFAGIAGRFFSWAGQQVMSLLQIIFEVVAPGVMPYIRKAGGAFQAIIHNPIGFVHNLVNAGVNGFRQFAANFLKHLRNSLVNWITGTLSGAGVYIPQAFSLPEIVKFVLSVLGLTWQNIRGKLVKAIGETAVKVLETGFDLVVTLVTQGPAAAWEKIMEGVSDLKDMVLEQIMTFVRDRVVQAAITKLVTSLNPAGAFIQAIIATYNTVMFFVERLQQIGRVTMAFIDSISAIANGSIGAAANRVEETMAGMLTLVISFLARIAGLGKVSDAVVNIVNKVREPIDRALDRVVDWIVAMARKVGKFFSGSPASGKGGAPAAPAVSQPTGPDIRTPEMKQHDLDLAMAEARAVIKTAPDLPRIRERFTVIRTTYRLKSLEVTVDDEHRFKENFSVSGEVNPSAKLQIPGIHLPPRPFVFQTAVGFVIQSPIGPSNPVRMGWEEKAQPPPGSVGLSTYHSSHLRGISLDLVLLQKPLKTAPVLAGRFGRAAYISVVGAE